MILSHYIDVKSIQVISGFNFQKMNRITRWRCSTNISKTYPKIMISPLLAHPQGKTCKTKLKTTLVSWSTEIQLKLNRIQKTFRKQGFFDHFCSISILMVFYSFFNFDWIFLLQLTRMDSSQVVWIFWHPWHPCEHINAHQWPKKIWSFRSLWYTTGLDHTNCCYTHYVSLVLIGWLKVIRSNNIVIINH